jgi:chemotaxis protein MotA
MSQYFDPISLLLVWGGAMLVAAMRSTRRDIGGAIRALGPAWRAKPDEDALAAARAVRQVEQLAEMIGLACVDHVDSGSGFVRRAALKLADASSAEDFGSWGRSEIDERAARHEAAIAVWRSMAEAAPALGMIGTVIGLAGLFSVMDDPSKMGPAMAVAVLTTLYGLVLSACIAGPIAARLERLSLAERRWQQVALARLEQLARSDLRLSRHDWLRKRGGAPA